MTIVATNTNNLPQSLSLEEFTEGPRIQYESPSFLYFPMPINRKSSLIPQIMFSGREYNLLGQGYYCPSDATPRELVALYDVWASDYDTQHPWAEHVGEDIYEILNYSLPDNCSILDICSGTGNASFGFIKSLNNNSVNIQNVTLVDLSQRMLDEAKKKIYPANTVFKQENVLEYNSPDKFDVALCALGLDHISLKDIPSLHNTIKKQLRENGLFIIVMSPNHRSHIDRLIAILSILNSPTKVIVRNYISGLQVNFPLLFLIVEINDKKL